MFGPYGRTPYGRKHFSLLKENDNNPNLLLQSTILKLGDKVNDGEIVEAVTLPWLEIVKQISKDPRFLYQLPWRRMEELIAGAYEQEGWDEVILTPRSGDRGRDIIAIKRGICQIRIVDQVKALGPGEHVTANDVRALIGVLYSDPQATKGFVTTTARFAPRIQDDPSINPFIPYRLELIDGDALITKLTQIENSKGNKFR